MFCDVTLTSQICLPFFFFFFFLFLWLFNTICLSFTLMLRTWCEYDCSSSWVHLSTLVCWTTDRKSQTLSSVLKMTENLQSVFISLNAEIACFGVWLISQATSLLFSSGSLTSALWYHMFETIPNWRSQILFWTFAYSNTPNDQTFRWLSGRLCVYWILVFGVILVLIIVCS